MQIEQVTALLSIVTPAGLIAVIWASIKLYFSVLHLKEEEIKKSALIDKINTENLILKSNLERLAQTFDFYKKEHEDLKSSFLSVAKEVIGMNQSLSNLNIKIDTLLTILKDGKN